MIGFFKTIATVSISFLRGRCSKESRPRCIQIDGDESLLMVDISCSTRVQTTPFCNMNATSSIRSRFKQGSCQLVRICRHVQLCHALGEYIRGRCTCPSYIGRPAFDLSERSGAARERATDRVKQTMDTNQVVQRVRILHCGSCVDPHPSEKDREAATCSSHVKARRQ